MNQNGKKRCHSLKYGPKKNRLVRCPLYLSSGNLTELEKTPLSRAICNLECRQLTQSITVHVVPKILSLLLLKLTLVTFVWLSVPDKN